MTTAVLQCLFFSLELSCFVVANRLTAKALASMLVFHDYLISYRLTPRSRILRKHLPKMTMVLEEESCMDQSSIMMSQSRIMSVTHMSSNKLPKRFVYHEDNPERVNTNEGMVDGESSSDDDLGSDNDDMERDLKMLDPEQADFIRKINQSDFMSFSNKWGSSDNRLTFNQRNYGNSPINDV